MDLDKEFYFYFLIQSVFENIYVYFLGSYPHILLSIFTTSSFVIQTGNIISSLYSSANMYF